MRMTKAHWDAMVAHAQEEAPNECCGYLKLDDGVVADVVRARNERQSPYGYDMDFKSKLAANEVEDEGYGLGIYHSHPRSPAEPSQTDINLAASWDWIYLIVSLENDPVIRAWRMGDGRVKEEPIVVE
jgi:[CysO sulfur-carrier protein]-S-L-cysteine hydrolase